jgi:hypothetical protein
MPIMKRPLIGPNQLPAFRWKFSATDSTPSMIFNVPAFEVVVDNTVQLPSKDRTPQQPCPHGADYTL